jgi:hypothetical protein
MDDKEAKKAAKKAANEANMQRIRDEIAAKAAQKLSEKMKDPEFAAKYAEKQAKQEAFDAQMLARREEKEALKALSPEEAKAAKRAANEATMQKLRDEREAKEALKLAAKLNDPEYAAKHAAKEAKRAASEAAMAQRQKEKEELAEKIGKKVADEIFALKRVRIYENGYIEIGLGLASTPEKLVSIQSSADITKKSGLGRAAAGVMTVGLNSLASNRRGDLMLVIDTDVNTRVLNTENPTTEDMKAMKKLEAVGNSVLARLSSTSVSPASVNSTTDLSVELARLNDLHKSGVLTAEEFSAAKSKLLGL